MMPGEVGDIVLLLSVCTVCLSIRLCVPLVHVHMKNGFRLMTCIDTFPALIMRGTSNKYPQLMFSWRNKKNIKLIPLLYQWVDESGYQVNIFFLFLHGSICCVNSLEVPS